MKINIGDIVPDSYWDNHINNPAREEEDICPHSILDGEEEEQEEEDTNYNGN